MQTPHVFMIGWELPPQNSGGLGVACAGLTRALTEDGVHIDFTLPYEYQGETDFINVIDCYHLNESALDSASSLARRLRRLKKRINHATQPPFSVYVQDNPDPGLISDWQELKSLYHERLAQILPNHHQAGVNSSDLLAPFSDMECQVADYGELVFEAALRKADEFDIVHAHDWMSLPAAIKIKEELDKPMVAHIHSTEFDRTLSPSFNSYIARAEYEGMRLADKVIAVSYYTKRLLVEKYMIDPYKIEVVHNGIEQKYEPDLVGVATDFAAHQPVVVFMGRLTMQKGADYFLALADKILTRRPDALFILAGNGDMYHDLLFRNAYYGLSSSVLFTDFLRGPQRDALLQRADVFVMPSVSEPFGLVALEAIQAGAPVVISKNSGVAEVLYDTPAVDFWDIDQLANETLMLINDQNYHHDLLSRQHAQLKGITWKKSAKKIKEIYRKLAAA